MPGVGSLVMQISGNFKLTKLMDKLHQQKQKASPIEVIQQHEYSTSYRSSSLIHDLRWIFSTCSQAQSNGKGFKGSHMTESLLSPFEYHGDEDDDRYEEGTNEGYIKAQCQASCGETILIQICTGIIDGTSLIRYPSDIDLALLGL
jgi:hypothetical protein